MIKLKDKENFIQFLKFKKLVQKAENIRRDYGLSWERKYDLIFSNEISSKIRSMTYNIEYYDPDTSYEEDVNAYVNALVDYLKNNFELDTEV
jgi:phenylalanyl-tRNA synthetase beta subunit